MLCGITLCYAMLCYSMRCDAMRCDAMRSCVMVFVMVVFGFVPGCCWPPLVLVLFVRPVLRRGGGAEKGTSRGIRRKSEALLYPRILAETQNATGNEPNSRLFRQQFWHKHSLSICRRLLPRCPCCLGRRLLGR